MKDQRCELCRYWDRFHGSSAVGLCHRYPPTLVTEIDCNEDGGSYSVSPIQVRPTLEADDWCGEFKEKESDEQQD